MKTNTEMPNKGLYIISKYDKKKSEGYVIIIKLETGVPIYGKWTPSYHKASGDILQLVGAFGAMQWILKRKRAYKHPIYITSKTSLKWLKNGVCKSKILDDEFIQFIGNFYNSTSAFDQKDRMLKWDRKWKIGPNWRVESLIRRWY